MKVLEGVRRIDTVSHPCPFVACMMACLNHLGDTPDYDDIMAVSGAAFRRFYHPSDGNAANVSYLGRELYRRAFRVVGRDYDQYPADAPGALEAALASSLDEGRPALGYRLDTETTSVLTGYDPVSRRVFGYSSAEPQRDTYTEIPGILDASNASRGIIILGERIGPPSARESLIGALDWGIELARSSRHLAWPDHSAGLAAYDSWLEALAAPAVDAADRRLLDARVRVLVAQMSMLSDRKSLVAYLRRATLAVPEVAAELARAADLYEEVAATADRALHGVPDGARKALVDPRRHKQVASIVHAAARNEAHAVGLLETALERLDPLPQRVVLPSPVRPKAYLERPRAPEDIPTPIVLRAAAELIGDNPSREQAEPGEWLIDPNHVLLMGVTGAAFCWEWLARPGMRPELPPELCESDPARLYECALAAMGLDGEVLLSCRQDAGTTDEATLLARIARGVHRRQLPAVLLTNGAGVGERFLVAGYDDGGASLIGWPTAPGGPSIVFDPQRRLSARRWYGATQGVVFIKSRGPLPDLDLVYRRALSSAVGLLTRTELGPYRSGAAMHAAWSEAIVDPELDRTDDVSERARNELVDPLIWDLAERRWYASLFVTRAARRFAAASATLESAAAELRSVHDLMYEINACAGGRWPGDLLPELGRPEVRRSMSTLMVQAAERDVRAAMCIERALSVLDGSRSQPVANRQ